jgi:hypothetical protein
MTTPIVIGPYAEPPVIERGMYRRLSNGRHFVRVAQKLASGGWHRIDTETISGDVRETILLPRADGAFDVLYVLPERRA